MAKKKHFGDYELADNIELIPDANVISIDKIKEESKAKFAQENLQSYAPDIIPLDDDFGKSKYDIGMTENEALDLYESRAQAQTNADKLANGVIKSAGLAATTFATTFTSLPYGILSALATGDPSKVFDNEISNLYDGFNKSMEEIFPNYYTREEQEAPVFSTTNIFSMNFLADKLIKNAGFTIGAIGAGGVTAKMFQALGKLAMSEKYTEDLLKVKELATAAMGNGMSEAEAFSTAVNKVGGAIKLVNNVTKAGATLVAAGTEASFEALGTKQQTYANGLSFLDKQFQDENYLKTLEEDFAKKNPSLFKYDNVGTEDKPEWKRTIHEDAQGQLDKYVKERYDDKLKELDKFASKAGTIDYIENLAILSTSNLIQFSKYLSGTKTLRKQVLGSVERQGGKFLTKEASKIGKIGRVVAKGLEGPLSETWEEGSQTFAQASSSDFYGKRFEGKSKGDYTDLLDAASYGLSQTFDTKNGQESMLLGFLTGAISGGVTGEISKGISEEGKKDKITRKFANEAEKATEGLYEKNKERRQSVIRANSYIKEKEEASKRGDIFGVKNASHNLLKNIVLSRIDIGQNKREILNEIEEFRNLDDASFQEFFNLDPSVEKKTKDEFIDDMKKDTEKLINLKEAIDLRFPQLTDAIREQIFDYASNVENYGQRMDQMSAEFKGEIKVNIENYLSDKTKENKEILNKTILEDKDAISNVVDLEKQVNDYIKLHDDREHFAKLYRDGVEQPEKLQKKADRLQKKDDDIAEEAKASKFKNNSIVINKDTGEIVGKLTKVNSKFRFQKTDEENNNIGDEEEVDPTSDEFINKYSVLETDVDEGNVNKEKVNIPKKEIKTYANKKTGEEVKVSKSKKEGKILIIENGKIVEKSIDDLNNEYVHISSSDDQKLYETKEENTQLSNKAIIYDKGNGIYLVKHILEDKNGTKYLYEEINKKELDKNYRFLKDIHTSTKTKNMNIIRNKIKETNKEKEAIINNITQINNTIKYLKKLLNNTNDYKINDINRAFKEIKSLLSLINSNSKKNTKYGKNVQEKIEQLNNSINNDFTFLNDIQNRINELNEILDQFNSIEKDLTNKINYYNNLLQDKNFKKFSQEEIYSKFEELTSKRNILKKLISKIKLIISKAKSFLKFSVNSVQNSLDRLDKFVLVNDFKELTPEEIKERIDKGTIGSYDKLKNRFDKLSQEVNNVLDILETKEKIIDKKNDNLTYLNKKLTLVDNNIRYIEDLFDFIIQYSNKKKEQEIKQEKKDDIVLDEKQESENNLDSNFEKVVDDTPTTPTLTDKTFKENVYGAMRTLSTGFRGFGGKHRDIETNALNSDIHQREYFSFTCNTKLSTNKYKGKLSFRTVNGTIQKFENYKDNIDKPIIDVYIVDKNGNYVDKNGKPTTDDNKKIRTTILTSEASELFRPYNEKKDRSQEDYDKKVAVLVEEWKDIRKSIIEKLEKGEEVFIPITGKSKGIPVTNKKEFGENKVANIKDVGINTNNLDIKVSTKDRIPMTNEKSIGIRPGMLYGIDEETGNVIPLGTRQFEDKEIDFIINLFNSFLSKHNIKDNQISSKNASILSTKDSGDNLIDIKDDNNKTLNIFDVLHSFTFWTGNNLKQEAERKYKGHLEDAYNDKKNLRNKNENTAFHFVSSNIPGGVIQLGTKTVNLFVNTEKGYIPNPELEGELRNFFSTQYINVSAKEINDNSGFYTIKNLSKDKNGVYTATLENKYKENRGYKQWLLNNDIITTPIIPKTTVDNNTGEEVPQFDNVYAIGDFSKFNNNKISSRESRERIIRKQDKQKEKENKYVDEISKIEEEQLFGDDINPEGINDADKIFEREKVTTTEIGNTNIPKEGFYEDNELTEEEEQNLDATFDKKIEKDDTDEDKKYTHIEPTKKKKRNNKFRPVIPNTKEQIEIKKSLVWLDKAFGGRIKVAVLNRLIQGNKWGMYRNKLILLYKNAGIGTEYHESFHVVRDLFLTDKEVKELFNEYREKNNKPDLTDDEVEELIAEDFSNYMLGIDVSYIKSNKEKTLFQTIISFIRNFIFGKPNTIQNVFDNLVKGKYAKMPFASEGSGISNFSSSIKEMSSKDVKDIVDGVNNYFFRYIFDEKDGLSKLTRNKISDEIIKDAYLDAEDNIIDVYNNTLDLIANSDNENEKNKLREQRNVLFEVLKKENWDKIIEIHKEKLREKNLIIESEWNIDIPEKNRHKDSSNTWARESLKYSAKMNANKNIKLLIASLPLVDEKRDAIPNAIGLPTTIDYGKFFNIIINKLGGITDWNDMIDKLDELVFDVPSILVLKDRLGANKLDDELTADEVMLRTQFQQAMAKHENIFEMDKVSKDGSTVFNSNQNSYSKRKIREWRNNSFLLSRHNGLYSHKKNNKVLYNKQNINKLHTPSTLTEAFSILHLLGIDFSNIDNISKDNQLGIQIINRTGELLNTIKKGDGILIFDTEEDGNAYGDINFFANIERTTTIDAVDNSLFNMEGHIVQSNTLFSYITSIIDGINNDNITNIKELYEEFPHLRYVTNSLVLDHLFDKGKSKISFSIHEGSIQEEYYNNKTTFADLKPADRLRVRINRTMNGVYNLLRPSDNKLERFIEFGLFYSQNDILSKKHISQFTKYLYSELIDNMRLKNSNVKNVNNNYKHGILLDVIKSTDDDLYQELVTILDDEQDIDKYFEDTSRIELIEKAVTKYIKNQQDTNKQLMLDNGLLVKNSNGTITSYGLSSLDKTMTEENLNNFIEIYTVNSLVGNIEQMKIFFGNPILYKSVEELFKRNSGATGTKKISIVSNYLNHWINKYTDKFSTVKQQYKNGKPIIKTAIVDDVNVVSRYLEKYKNPQVLGKVGDEYGVVNDKGNINETDAVSVIHIDEYRRMLIRSGDWTYDKGSMEERYQYEKNKLLYVDPKTNQTFKIDEERVKKVVFPPLKPLHYGPLAEEGFIQSMYKTALVPLTSRLAVKFPTIGKIMKQMEQQQIGIISFANKFGTLLNEDGIIQPVYNEKGKFNFDKDNLMRTQDTYYKYWGIQVDMGNTVHNKNVWGTQTAKQIMNNLFSQAKAKAMRFWINDKLTDKTPEATQERVNKYLELNKKRIENGYKALEEKLGLKRDKDNNYIIDNPEKLITQLKDEAKKGEDFDNIINSIDYLVTTGIDTLPNREKLEQIIMALAKNTVISQKTYGAPMVQVSSVFMEKNGIRKITNINDKSYFVSNDLEFYKPKFNKDGDIIRVKSMQVMIPSKFKGIIDVKTINDKRLLKALGFRIPTQGLNSIESIEIVGFLPDSMGDTIVLPSEIVTKTGSDFDIDKLNVYLPEFFYDRTNNPIYIDNTISYENYMDRVSNDTMDQGKVLTEIQYKKAQIENELKEVMNSIITSPDNITQLLTPNTTDLLEESSIYIDYLDELKNKTFEGTFNKYKKYLKISKESTSFNKIIETKYLLDVANIYLTAQSAVGVTANYNNFHVLAQLNNLSINDTYETIRDKKLVKLNTNINLKHNSTGEGKIAIGGTESITNESIVQGLSMWISAAVDAVNNPFMAKLNANMQTLNTILYLNMAGCSRKTIALFMHQPIILEYIKNQEKYTSIVANISKNIKSKEKIIKITAKSFENNNNDITEWTNGVFTGQEDTDITDKKLKDEILSGGTKFQQQILSDFIRYQDIGKEINNGIQGISYDTGAGGKNISELIYKLAITQKVLDNRVINNYDKALNEGFMEPYYNAVKKIKDMIKIYVPHMRNSNVENLINNFMSKYLRKDVNFKEQDIIDTITKFKQDFITYLILTKINKKNGKRLVDNIDRLFRGNSNMANRLLVMKKKYPRNSLLDNLLPIFNQYMSEESIDNIKMYVTKLENVESNQLTQDWTDLFEGSPEERAFANDLMQLVVLQSGLQNSSMNFIKLVPVKYYDELTKGILNTLDDETNTFRDFPLQFEIHNQNNKLVVPRGKIINGFSTYMKKVGKDDNGKNIYKITDAETHQVLDIENPPYKDFKNNKMLQTYGKIKVNNSTTVTDEGKKIYSKTTIQPKIKAVDNTITYTPKGKKTQTYRIKGSKIFNSKGKEVFSTDSIDRNKIYANFAVKQGRAIIVEYNNRKYIVNDKGSIISAITGRVMKWGEKNKNRIDIMNKYNERVKEVNQKKTQKFLENNDNWNTYQKALKKSSIKKHLTQEEFNNLSEDEQKAAIYEVINC